MEMEIVRPSCARGFASGRGLSQHRRHAQLEDLTQDRVAGPCPGSAWSSEEDALLSACASEMRDLYLTKVELCIAIFPRFGHVAEAVRKRLIHLGKQQSSAV